VPVRPAPNPGLSSSRLKTISDELGTAVTLLKAKPMTTSKASRRPPIHMIDTEAEALSDLALAAQDRVPQVSELLLDETARATTHAAERIPTNVVTMHATVRFIDEASGKEHSFQLVYPGEADISAGRISILTPVGAGLIGLREGQSILWPDRDGHERELKIVAVSRPAAAAGGTAAQR
jgi:regulator of nucleoside diphosphate kinase